MSIQQTVLDSIFQSIENYLVHLAHVIDEYKQKDERQRIEIREKTGQINLYESGLDPIQKANETNNILTEQLKVLEAQNERLTEQLKVLEAENERYQHHIESVWEAMKLNDETIHGKDHQLEDRNIMI